MAHRLFKDFSNTIIDKITVNKFLGGRCALWECICECGKIINVRRRFLESKSKKSCGCHKQTLDITHPKLCKEWHKTLNGNKTPSDFTFGTETKIWWQCPEYEEDIYETSICNRTSLQTNCPFCAGIKINNRNCFYTTHKQIIEFEWSSNNTINPKNVVSGSNLKALFICDVCDNEYEEVICNRTRRNQKCPICYSGHRLTPSNCFANAKTIPNGWVWGINNTLDSKKLTINADLFIILTHEKCGKDKKYKVHQLEKISCSYCDTKYKNEKLIGQILKDLDIQHNAQFHIPLPPLTRVFIDFNIPGANLYIEYNGAQHYVPVRFGGCSIEEAEKNFIRQKYRDNIVRNYCKENSIKLLEIDGRYYTRDKLKKYVISYFVSNHHELIKNPIYGEVIK